MKNKNYCCTEKIYKVNSKKFKPSKTKSHTNDYYVGCDLVVDKNNRPINIGDFVQINCKNSAELIECEVIEIGANNIVTVLYDDCLNVNPIETIKVPSNETIVI